MRALHLPAFEYRRMRWKNGLGWTREILATTASVQPDGPDIPASQAWDWRASIAEIDHDCPFSAFPDHDRILVLLSGNGMQLQFEHGRRVELLPPHQRIAFRGEDALHCTLLDGPTRDFNLIWNRHRVRAELMHRPLVGPMVFFPAPQVQWLVHLIGGEARLRDRPEVARLEAGDSLLLQGGADDASRAILDGGAQLLLARIEALR